MHSLFKTSFILIVSCVSLGKCLEDEIDIIGHPVVHTKLGPVRGNTQKVLNSTLNVFYGIPYAKPPLRHLRFKYPVPADVWTNTLDCTQKRKACMQYKRSRTKVPVQETEDCLYVNVNSPKGMVSETNYASADVNSIGTLLPVMFFIYGGTFLRGATEWYDSRALAATNNVITVAVSYRIGAFGYLYSGTPEAPGNAGSYDQLMALQWVHDNIACFGGDPGSVTVFGGSSGGYSTGHLLLSPLSHNLFHRAIFMSGTPTSYNALSTSLVNNFLIIEELGNFTGCNRYGNTLIPEIVVCLENITAEKLDLAQESFSGYYRPVLDGRFLPVNVTTFYSEAVRKNVSVFLGVVKDEGTLFVSNTFDLEFTKPQNMSQSHQILLDMINDVLDLRFNVTPLQNYTLNYVYSHLKDINDNEANRQKAVDFMGDCSIVCPTNDFGIQLSDRNLDVFYYKFDQRPSSTTFPEWMGVVHGDDLPFVFPPPLKLNSDFTPEEVQLSYKMMKVFGNFAKYGIPSYEGFVWPRYSRDNQIHVALDVDGETIGKDFRASYCEFWNGIYPLWVYDLDKL